ncbi:MAG: BACON domain-containing protein [Oscillospiraceae bacterium]|nr:BACON domain-containing protein [Oscillospiraceae bacterium]
MRKLLSICLAVLLLGASLGVGAPALAEELTLQPQLPVVTAIDADWNGEIQLNHWNLTPQFTLQNVTVTVHFDDGTSEALERWSGQLGAEWWEILRTFDPETLTATFTYTDSATWRDFDGTWAEYVATMPSASFTLSDDFVAQYLGDIEPIVLGEPASFGAQETRAFSLTVAEDDYFGFSWHSGDLYLRVFDANLTPVGTTMGLWVNNSWHRRHLPAGDYVIFAWPWSGWQGGDHSFSVSVTEPPAPLPPPSPHPYLNISPAGNRWQTSRAGSFTRDLYSNTSWRVTAAERWLHVSPSRGTGDAQITIRVLPNSSNQDRFGVVNFVSDCGIVRSIRVHQYARPPLGPDAGMLEAFVDWLQHSTLANPVTWYQWLGMLFVLPFAALLFPLVYGFRWLFAR